MQIAEPTTMITDYVLAACCIYFGLAVLRPALRQGAKARVYWGVSFLIAGFSTFVGGSMHGFRPMLDMSIVVTLWMITLYGSGLASLTFLVAAAQPLQGAFRKAAIAFALVKFPVYAVAVTIDDNFLFAIADYGSAMLLILAIHATLYLRHQRSDSKFIAAGVIVSFIAAGIQTTGITVNEYLNYNDIYHVVQIAGMYLFYRGARLS